MKIWEPNTTYVIPPEVYKQIYERKMCDRCGDAYHKDEMRAITEAPLGRYLCLPCSSGRD